MNKNTDNVPAEIFDWLQQMDFEALNTAQQKQVLLYFSKEEYWAMHLAALAMAKVNNEKVAKGRAETKVALLAKFDSQHPKVIRLYKQPVFYWQAAAMFLLLLSGWLFYRNFEIKSTVSDSVVASTDTIYVDREVKSGPEIIHDTVYRYKLIKESRRQKEELPAGNNSEEVPASYFMELPSMDLKELHNTANSLRRNSMKDDSLLKKYGFVTM